MSAGGAGEAKKSYSPESIMGIGIAGGLIGIYLGTFLSPINPVFSAFGGIGAICAIVWGADAVRRVASYGLGTGVPSIGMIALGMGIVTSLFGLSVGGIAGPIVAFVAAGVIGAIIGLLANKVIGMGIPIMEKAMVEIAGAGSLVIIGFSVVIAGTFEYGSVIEYVVAPGFIAMIFIFGGMGILHPFNANLGPDEKQDRTLIVAVEKGALALAIAGLASAINEGLLAAFVTFLIGVIIWYLSFSKYFAFVVRDAHKVVGSGLLPTEEELQ